VLAEQKALKFRSQKPSLGVSVHYNKIWSHHPAETALGENISTRNNPPCARKVIMNGRNLQLDGLRALAVTSVLIHHFWPTSFLKFANPGHLGVRLFFVLSGYLITGILLRCRSSVEAGQSHVGTNLRQFYIRRFLRIFPPYYALLALMLVADVPGVRDTLWWHAGYASNFLFALRGDWIPSDTSHFWSLAVEEQFYLVWPFLVLLVPRSRLVAIVIAITVSVPLFRVIMLLAGVKEFSLWWLTTPFSLDALGMGSLLALCADHPAAWRRLTRLGLIAIPLALTLGIVLLVYDRPWLNCVVNETVAALALTYLVAKTAEGFGGLTGRLLTLQPLQYVGKISYGIYLYHLFVLRMFWKLLRVAHLPPLNNEPVLFLVVSLMTVAMATLSWKFLEQPLNGLKRHFPYQPEGPQGGAHLQTRLGTVT
jgi:peptidoglycan/LPS O-acetylase OafA/YrhL